MSSLADWPNEVAKPVPESLSCLPCALCRPALRVCADFVVNTLSIYKFRMINVELTKDVHYVL